MTTIHVHRDPTQLGDGRITFTYDPTLVGLVKAVPAGSRTWDPTAKTWTLRYPHLDRVLEIARSAGHTVINIPGRQQSATPQRPAARERADQWARDLLAAVGPMRAELVYKALVKILHPDVGGDTALMQQLNQARRATRS